MEHCSLQAHTREVAACSAGMMAVWERGGSISGNSQEPCLGNIPPSPPPCFTYEYKQHPRVEISSQLPLMNL